MDRERMNAFLRLMKDAYRLAEKAHNCSLDDEELNLREDKCSALSYAAACTAKYSAAEAIYWTSPELAHPELPCLFAEFDAFVNEIQEDYETNHSRQWVSIQFDRIKELFDASVCAQPIAE